MEFKLALDVKKFVRIPDVLIAGEKNVIVLESNLYKLGTLAIVIKNEHKEDSYVLENKQQIDITEFCKKACKIEIKVELIMSGRTVKIWYLEPLIVREIDKGFELIPELVAMRNDIATMKKVIAQLNTRIKETM